MKLFSFTSCSVQSTAKPRKFGWRGGAAARFLMGVGIAGVILGAGATSASAANYYWDPSATFGTGSGGAGTWNTTTANWYVSGAADTAWVNGNTAIFGGTSGTVTLGSAISALALTFNTAGYTLNTSTFALTLGTGGITTATGGTTTVGGTVTSNGSQTWTVGASDTLQFNAAFTSPTAANTLTINSAGTTNITSTFSAVGKSTLSGGGIINLSGTEGFVTGSGDYAGIANATVNNTAGTAAFTPGAANSFFIGNSGSATQPSVLNISGGTVSVANAANQTRIFIGDGFSGTNVAGDGTLIVGGGAGAALFTTGTTTNASNFLGNASATGTISLLANGTFATNRSFAAGATGKGIVNFNGGTFQATGTAAALANTITAPIAEGGATIDSQTFAITMANNFTHGGTAATDGGLTLTSSAASGKGVITLSGILSQTGGLTVNTGATLSGNNTYTGPTSINAFVDGKTSGNIFGATGAGNGTTISAAGTLRFRDTTNATIPEAITLNGGALIDYNDPGTTTYSGPITLNTNSTIQIQPQAQASTTTVFSSGFAEGGTASNLVLLRNGAAGTASNDIVNITGASTYGGSTTITDALNTNTGTFSVKLSGGDNRLPTTTAVTLGGAGGGGNAAGSGRLILGDATTGAVSQTLTGLVTSGTGANNAVVGANTTASTLVVNNAAADTYAGKLGGTGTNNNSLALTKSGAGTLTLTSANTYTGGTTVNNGTLALGAAAADGAGALAVNNGGTVSVSVTNALGGGDTALGGGSTLQNALITSGGTANDVQTSSNLTIASGVATLDFGLNNQGAKFTFTNANADTFGGILNIINYTGNPFDPSTLAAAAGGGLDQLFFAPGVEHQLTTVYFINPSGNTGTYQGRLLTNGEVVAPEPSQWAALLIGTLGLGGLSLKARRRTLAA